MGGVLVVVVLAGLIMPISLLLLAVVFDALVLAWAAEEVIRREVWPGATHWVSAHWRMLHLPHSGLRHH